MCKYLKSQFRLSMFNLEHENPSDFYLSCWQKNRASLPFLCIRLVLFLTCVAILVASLVITSMAFDNLGLWFIYMTHWGVLLNTITTGLATAVSCSAYFKGPIDSIFSLPWYIKTYWAFFNAAVPMAFFITIYYYVLLSAAVAEEWNLDPVLDFFLHGMNSIVMFLLLMTSRHPTRLMHFYFVVCIGTIYLAFSGIYYVADGRDPMGNPFIYPTLDWTVPGETIVMAVVAAVSLVVFYILVVALGAIRDVLSGNFAVRTKTISISNDAY